MKKLIGILSVLLLMGCTRTVYIPQVEVRTDTIIHNNTLVLKDTVYESHTESLYTKGDTVYKDKIIYKYKEKSAKSEKSDTIIQRDTIPVPYPVPVEVEVIKYRTPAWVWCFFCMLAVGIAGWLYRRFKNVKELLD